MRVALVHDYIKEYGGAERVLEALHEIFPDAPVYTSVYCPKFLGPHRGRFKGWKIKTSVLQYVPFKEKLISPFRIIAPFIFSRFDFSDYDAVIVSATGAYISNSIKIKNQKSKIKTTVQSSESQNHKPHATSHMPVHVCYCHTPPRYLYGYMTAREWKKNIIFRVLGEIANHFLRQVDFKAAQNVDYFIANSEEVRSRIKKFYRRDSVIINPPVDTKNPKSEYRNPKQIQNPKYEIPNTGYYLTGGRLARAKGTDVIIDTFIKLGKPLKIFGKGFAGWEKNFKFQMLNVKCQIEYLGEVTDEEKFELMKNAKAFIFASYDEDFGITPVEAMSVGCPVIAYRSGGVQETVVNGKTGVFYNKNTPEELEKAINKFEECSINPKKCEEQAQKFSKDKFVEKIKVFVNKNCR